MTITRILITALVAALAVPAFSQAFHFSARFIPAGGGRANVVYLADSTGTVTGQYAQIAGANADPWGYRDGAANRSDQVMFGWSGGVAIHNADGSGGALMIAGAAPGGVGTWRALAFDPTGNGGAGSLWTASFGSSLIETTLGGALLNTFVNPAANPWSLYGLAYDDATGNLWGHSRVGAGLPEVIEIDTATGAVLGAPWFSDFGVAGPPIQGGLSGYRAGGGTTLVGVLQTTADTAFSANMAGVLTGPLAANPRDLEIQTANNGHLGVASPVPEPASMIALGLGAVALLRRRKKA